MALLVLRNVAGFLIQILPCAVLCCVPFLNRFTVPRRKLAGAFGFVFAVALAAFTAVGTVPLVGTAADMRILVQNLIFLATLGVLFVVYVRAIDASTAQKGFVFLLVAGYGFLVTQGADTVGLLAGFPAHTDGHLYPLHWLGMLALFNGVFFWPMLALMRYLRSQLDAFADDRTWWRMAALPAGLLLVMLVAGWLSTAWLDAEGVNSVLVLALSAFALFQYWWVLRSMRAESDDAARRAELETALVESERQRDELAQSLEQAMQDAKALSSKADGEGGGRRGASFDGSVPVVLATPSKAVSFRPDDVLYVESLNRERLVHLASGEVATTSVALGQIVERLPEGRFVYCHRSIVVSLAQVRELTRSEVVLKDGTVLPASRRRYQGLSDALVAQSGA